MISERRLIHGRMGMTSNLVYACLITSLTFALVLSVSAQSTNSVPLGDVLDLRRYSEQGALFCALMTVLFFYRRDFAERHAQLLQYQATLIAALNENSRASATCAASNISIANAVTEVQRTLLAMERRA